MNYGRSLLVLAALGLAACANETAIKTKSSTSSVGTFRARNDNTLLDLNGMPQVMVSKQYLTIGVNTVEVVKVCRRGDEKVIAKITAPAVVSDRHFEVKTAQSKTEKLGRLECTVKLAAGVTAFEVKDNGLTLTDANGSSFYGYRVGQTPGELEKWQKRAGAIGRGTLEFVKGAVQNYDDSTI